MDIAPTRPRPEHGLRFTDPVTTWDEALPLGNGLLGALVWGDGQPLRLSLDRTDLWDLRPVPEFTGPDYTFAKMRRWHAEGRVEDLQRQFDEPYRRPAPTKLPAGRIELHFAGGFQACALDVATAAATVTLGEAAVEVRVHATEPIGLITATRAPREVRLAAPRFGGEAAPQKVDIRSGELALLGYDPPEEHGGETWRGYVQTGALGFRWAVVIAWRAGETWRAAWSIATSEEVTDPLALARDRAEAAATGDPGALIAAHEAWWAAFWARATVAVPNATVERQWYLDTYKFGAASRRGHPPITLQGPWTADDGMLPPWKGDYHHDLNTQLSYWPCYSGNHLEEGLAFLDWLWDTRGECAAWTQDFWQLPGMNVPGTADLRNRQIGGWRQYTHSATTGCWLAHHFYQHWRYSHDREFLAERAYPYLREVAVFIEAVTAGRDAAGNRWLPLSASPEIHNNAPEAWFDRFTNYDLALCRWLLGAAGELADELERPDEARTWWTVRDELPPLATDSTGKLLIAPGEPLGESHRHFSHLMALHPLGLLDWTDGETARRTWHAALLELDTLGTRYWTGYSFAWLANLAARARDGERAERALEIFSTAFCLRNSFHCNGDQSGDGFSTLTYRPFTLEGNFAAAAGLQEMLLQSHRGVIRVFPAVPPSWSDASFDGLLAEGGFRVSAVREGGATRRIELVAEQDGTCRLADDAGIVTALSLKAGQQVVIEPR